MGGDYIDLFFYHYWNKKIVYICRVISDDEYAVIPLIIWYFCQKTLYRTEQKKLQKGFSYALFGSSAPGVLWHIVWTRIARISRIFFGTQNTRNSRNGPVDTGIFLHELPWIIHELFHDFFITTKLSTNCFMNYFLITQGFWNQSSFIWNHLKFNHINQIIRKYEKIRKGT